MRNSARAPRSAERATRKPRAQPVAEQQLPAPDPRRELIDEADAIDPRLGRWLARLLGEAPDEQQPTAANTERPT